MAKRFLMYPMTKDQCAIARYSDMMKGCCISGMLVPPFWNLNNVDVSAIDGGTKTKLTIEAYSKEMLPGNEALYIDFDENMESLGVYLSIMEDAKHCGLDVFLSNKLALKLENETKVKAGYENAQIHAVHRLYEIPVPIVTVLSQGTRTDQLAVELALRSHFAAKGYNVSQIGSIFECEFFGFEGFPNFMHFDGNAYNQALMFNHYCKNLVDREKPDVLIIGIPGAIMKYSDGLLNGLGIFPFIVCSAIRSDLQILCMYHGNYNKKYFDEMEKFGNYRFNSPFKRFCLSNTMYSPDLSNDIVKNKYLDVDCELVINAVKGEAELNDIGIYSPLDKNSVKQLCDSVLNELATNAQNIR